MLDYIFLNSLEDSHHTILLSLLLSILSWKFDLDAAALSFYYEVVYHFLVQTSLGTSVLGLRFYFNTRNESFDPRGDFELHINCGGGCLNAN
jgi:hypothetical protein